VLRNLFRYAFNVAIRLERVLRPLFYVDYGNLKGLGLDSSADLYFKYYTKRASDRDRDARSRSSHVARCKTLSEKSTIRSGYKRNRCTGRRYTHGDEFRSKAIVLAAVTFIENAKETRCLRTVLRLAINSYTSCRESQVLADCTGNGIP